MTKLTKIAGLIALLLLALTLAGCNTPTPAPESLLPTPDLDQVRTQSAQTVVAKITQDALMNPSPTAVPVEPSATAWPTVTVPAAPAVSSVTPLPAITATKPPASGGGGGGGVFIPSKTPYTDSAQWISQSPKDGSVFTRGSDFDLIWTIKNTGLRDWNSSFYLRYLSGVKAKNQAGDEYTLVYLPAVERNSTVDIRVDMVAPLNPGSYNTTWQLVNDDGVVILTPNLVFTVQ